MPLRDRFFEELPRMQEGNLELLVAQLFPGSRERRQAPAYLCSMLLEGVDEPVGGIDLRLSQSHDTLFYAGQVGFAVGAPYRGRGLAARSLRLLLPLARRHGFGELWITCNPDNLASRRTCERAGATLVEVVAVPPEHEMFARGEREKCRYRLDLELASAP